MAEELKKSRSQKIKPEHKIEQATRENDPFEVGAYNEILQVSDYDPTLRTKGFGQQEFLKLYRECDADARIGSLLDTRKAGVLKNRYSIVSGGDKPEDKSAADLVRFWLDEIDDNELIRGLLDSALYGYAVTELVWETDAFSSGHWLPILCRNKQPERFTFDKDFNLRLLTRMQPYEGLTAPQGKFILCRRDFRQDNPFGKALGTSLWWLLFFRSNGAKFWARQVDRFGSPITVVKYPSAGINTEEMNKIKTMLASIRRDTGIMIPEHLAIDLLNANATNNDVYKDFLAWVNDEITIRIVGATLTTSTTGSSGSRAAGEVHERVSDTIIFEDAKRIEQTLNGQVFKWITSLNFANAKAPKIRFDLPALNAQIQRASRDKILKELGYTPKDAEEYAKLHYGMEIDMNYYQKNLDRPTPPSKIKMPSNYAVTDDLQARKEQFRGALLETEAAADEAGVKEAKALRAELEAQLEVVNDDDGFEELLLQAAEGDGTKASDLLHDALVSADLFGRQE